MPGLFVFSVMVSEFCSAKPSISTAIEDETCYDHVMARGKFMGDSNKDGDYVIGLMCRNEVPELGCLMIRCSRFSRREW